MNDTHAYTNELVNSRSPYLLQHAHNPVNWNPWGEEALQKAQEENKLIIISIGYAACHWCHVMEEESFEDTTVARLMNDHFVAIKVDREERPDVDQIYMNSAMLTTGRTGWPLNAIALPDGRPIFAATYFPREEWMRVLQQFTELYAQSPDKLAQMAAQVTEGVQRLDYAELSTAHTPFTEEQVTEAYQGIMNIVDEVEGGLEGAPKFPLPGVQELLLAYHQLTGAPEALTAVELTLEKMARGGIYDHVGGGFARYATDSIWKVPHFEKMLYDNAQLVSLYSKAHRVSQNPAYKRVVMETLDFIAQEMTDSLGGFYSSLDADSDGEEGRYYVWTEKAFTKAVGMDARIFKTYLSVSPFGNWEESDAAEAVNILHVTEEPGEIARRYGLSEGEFWEKWTAARGTLAAKRAKRVRPGLDNKVLTSWNAMMISGYVDAYRAFGEVRFLNTALRNATFIRENLYTQEGSLYRSWQQGEAHINAFASDYALLIAAYLDLYQATFEEKWLKEADRLMKYTLTHFFDEATGLFFFTADTDDPLISRSRELNDNVIPGANSVLARDLWHLGHYLYRSEYLEKSRQMLQNVLPNIAEGTVSTANWTRLLSEMAFPYYEVAVVGEDAIAIRAEMDAEYLPNTLFLGGKSEGELELLTNKLVPGQTLIYVCREKSCKLPTPEVKVALQQIQ